MRSRLNLKTPEVIGLLEIDAPTNTQLASVNALESQNSNVSEQPTKKWVCTYSDTWKYFKPGLIEDDCSYEIVCNYYEKKYKKR
jgi:hypothetical protein